MSGWNERSYRALRLPSAGLEFTTDRPEYDAGSLISGEAMTVGEAQAMANMDLDVARDDSPLRPEFSARPGPHTSGDARGMIPDSEVPRGTMEDEDDE